MLRQLALTDMGAAAQVHRAAFDHAMPWLAGLHTPDEDRWFYREHVFATCRVWGRFEADVLRGIIAFRNGWVEQLYVLPAVQGRGVGTTARCRQAGQRTAGALDLPAQRVGAPLLSSARPR
jgi:GNAT superfamily N-acetyltransferase